MKTILILVFLFSACSHGFGRKMPEPTIERCSHFDDGRARCLQRDGVTLITREAHELEFYISTNPQDFEVYDNFCHRRREQ